MLSNTLLTTVVLTAAAALAAPVPDAAALQSVIIRNNCAGTVWVTEVASTTGATSPIGPGDNWRQPEHSDPKTGVAVKIGTSKDYLTAAKPTLHLSYTVNTNSDPSSIYYDLSTVNSYGFPGKKVHLHGSKPDVPSISWDGAAPTTQDTKAYVGATDLILDLCAKY